MRRYGTPEIFNSDQGVQLTSPAFLQPLKDAGVKISMDGKGRALDNVFIEMYNGQRPNASLDGITPHMAYNSSGAQAAA